MIGRRCGVGRETFDQFDDFKSLPGRKFQEGSDQSQAFNSFARWCSELPVQLCSKCGIFHLALSIGSGDLSQGKREGLAQTVDTAAMEVGVLA
jgi:hypothetical protein